MHAARCTLGGIFFVHRIREPAVRCTLLFISLLLLAACGDRKYAPDERIAGDGVSVLVEHWERCWEGCRKSEQPRLFGRWGELEKGIYDEQLGIGYQPSIHGLILLPKKRSFLTIVSDTNNGAVLVELAKGPRLTPLAGCWGGGGSTLSRLGRLQSSHCLRQDSATPAVSMFGPDKYYEALQVSLHGGFWLDYQSERVHEVAQGGPDYEDLLAPVSVAPGRRYLLAIYRTATPRQYKACAYGGGTGKEAPSRYCVEFDAGAAAVAGGTPDACLAPTDPAALRLAPVRTSGVTLLVENAEVTACQAAWLSRYLVFQPGAESPFSSASGRLPLTISHDNVA
eukprot:gene43997-54672_t